MGSRSENTESSFVASTRRALLLVLACASACSGEAGPRANAGPFSPVDLGGCTRAAVIEDAENADHQVLVHEGRNGYIYAFVDDRGSTVTPTAGRLGGTFSQAEGGANGSLFAAHVTGQLAAGEVVYAGVGLNFVDPKGPFDASAFEGVAFFARRGPGSTAGIRLKVPDVSTDPDGKVCSECFNDFGASIELDEQWQQFTVPFDTMAQLPGWGAPRPGAVDRAGLYGLQWQVSTSGAAFDLWIDDVVFYGCRR
jgi:endoglucanase